MDQQSAVQVRGLHHAAYTTRDVDATYDFYVNKLGLPLLHTEITQYGEGHFRHFFFGIGDGQSIAFFALENVGEEVDYKTAISTDLGLPVWANHIAFKLDTLDDLRAKTQELQANGLEDVLEIDHGWCTSVYVNDPNGIMVEYCVTTDAQDFDQTEEEALRLLHQPFAEFASSQPADASR